MMLLSVCLKCDFLKFRSGTAKHAVVQEQQKRFRHYAVSGSVAASDGVPVGCDLGEDRGILLLLCHGPLPFPLIEQRLRFPAATAGQRRLDRGRRAPSTLSC